MAKYIIPESDRTQINNNTNRPSRHEFWYEDDSEFIYDESTTQYYDFDYDAVFQTEFTKTLTEYLASLGKKAFIKAELYISDFVWDITNVDYRTLWLKKEEVMTEWEVSQVNFWAEYDEDTKVYSNKVVQEDIVFVRDTEWYVQNRTKNIKRINDDETIGKDKENKKYYTMEQAAILWENKRSNIVVKVKTSTLGLLVQTGEATTVAEAEVVGMPFLSGLCDKIFKFISWDVQPLIDAITNDTTYTWLNNDIGGSVTIRQYILSLIDYD